MGYLEASPYNYENQKLRDEVGLISQAITDVAIEESIVSSQRLPLTATEGTLRNIKLFSAFFDFIKIGGDVEGWLDPKYYFEEFAKLNSANFWREILGKTIWHGLTQYQIPTIAKNLPLEKVADNLSFDHSAVYGLSMQLASMAALRGQQALSEINVCAKYNGCSLDDNLYRAFREIAKTFPGKAKNPNDLIRRLEFLFPYFPKEPSLDSILERNSVYRTNSLESVYSPLYRRFIRSFGCVLRNEDYKKAMAIRFSPVTPESS
ncbi:hypothetical protein HY382_03180 [Candidatus Curtissbacteria bacterium]|nr:hypothetical protein [Candidatus Curtissbacteria bacterium]